MRTVSVVVNTFNRAESLRLTLDALQHLDYPAFEVVVVNGPSTDETDSLLQSYEGKIKVGNTENRNLSESRNIGVALSAGDVVAFIDDDAYPDPAWLDRIVEGYDHEEVAAAGGPVYNYTGVQLQVKYSIGSRTGKTWEATGLNPSSYLSSPGAANYLYLIGCNCSYRRSTLIDIGGFDEEFEYHLEDTDACLRLIDQGYAIRALDDGYVYHKAQPSHVRSKRGILTDRYSVIKNRCYFALKHGAGNISFFDVTKDILGWADQHRRELEIHLAAGGIESSILEQFDDDVHRAFDVGFERFREGTDRTRSAKWFHAQQRPFLPFPTLRAASDKLNICYVNIEYPPRTLNGIGRVVHLLATGMAARGHVVHVVTEGESEDRVDFEDGVWVHRIVPKPHPRPEECSISQGLWNYAASMRDELRRIHAHRRVDIVQVPNWGCEGIAILLEGEICSVLGLYTPMATVAEIDPRLRRADGELTDEIRDTIDLERKCYELADGYLACGQAIVSEIESRYGLTLPADRIGYVAHGLPDSDGVSTHRLAGACTPRTEQDVEVLFVGRLEKRKGADILIAAMPDLLDEFDECRFTIVGDDTILLDGERPLRAIFDGLDLGSGARERVCFTGVVDDSTLAELYRRCDIFVAPSRFESFGLILVEAMREGKPVIGCRIGGMVDIVEDGGNGYLVEPGDVQQLRDAIADLVRSPGRRQEFGSRSRELYETKFSTQSMIRGANEYYDDLLGTSTAGRLGTGSEKAPIHLTEMSTHHVNQRSESRQPVNESSLEDPSFDLVDSMTCPTCHDSLEALDRVVTAAGRRKEGVVVCRSCDCCVATVENFKYDFLCDRGPIPVPSPVLEVPELGEIRLPANDPSISYNGTWVPSSGGFMRSSGENGESFTYAGRFSDLLIRFMHQPGGGIVDVFVDDQYATAISLYVPEGSHILATPVASNLSLEEHSVLVRARGRNSGGSTHGTTVSVQELVLYGPQGDHFAEPQPLNFGNPYSPVIERYLDDVHPEALVLEVGGGDRRRGSVRHVNFEFLKFELADIFGDIHNTPFGDDVFDLVFSQAVFEHLQNPFEAAHELIRITKPGGIIITEAAFMQPLHAVPYHYFNATPWGLQELFKSCDPVESDWFGPLSFTIDWLIKSVNLPGKVPEERLKRLMTELESLDDLVSHDELRPAASGVYLVVRKPRS